MELPTVEPVFVKAKDKINFIQIKEIDMYESVTESSLDGFWCTKDWNVIEDLCK